LIFYFMLDRLYPTSHNSNLSDRIYTHAELAFPTEGIAFMQGDRLLHRPYIVFNMVSSVDGKASTSPGGLEGLGSRSDRYLMQRLRSQVDAVLVGGATLRVDPFIPTVPEHLSEERSRNFPDRPQPLGAIVSHSGDLPLEHRFWLADRDLRVVFLGESASGAVEQNLSTKAQVVRLPKDSQNQGRDLAFMLEFMFEHLGVRRLLIEGGPSLNYALISRHWSDEIFLTMSPRLVGGIKNITAIAGDGYGMGGMGSDRLPHLQLKSIYHHDSELYLRYQILNVAIEVIGL
jgi:2,5-diamino-6-(ribosylamino)-4(3H)-pyrimidinone 5'-phosphate reductase